MAVASLRFYLDENLPVEIARQLRSRGIEVVTVRDLGALGDDDITHLDRATAMGYVLCTYDADYVQLAAQGKSHAGIVFGQPEKHYIGEWVNWLELVHAIYDSAYMQDMVEYIK